MVPQTYMKDPAYWTLHSRKHQRDSESSFYSIITYLKAENEVQQKPFGTLGALPDGFFILENWSTGWRENAKCASVLENTPPRDVILYNVTRLAFFGLKKISSSAPEVRTSALKFPTSAPEFFATSES